MCGQHNVSASVGVNTRQNTDEGHTSNARTEIKIPDPDRRAGLVSRDSIDHATATDVNKIQYMK